MKFGIGWVINEGVTEAIRCAKEIEKIDYENIWLWQEPVSKNEFMIASILALNTNKIKIGLTAESPYYRNIVVLAASTLTLDNISGGRAAIGIATGDWRVSWRAGIKIEKPVLRLKETIESLKLMFTEEKAQYKGKTISFGPIKFGWINKKRRIPIYASILGPKMLEMAGETADGIMMLHTPIEYLDYALAQIKKGAEKTGRNFESLDLGVHLEIFMDEDYDKALLSAKRSYLQLGYFTYLPIIWEKAGFSTEEIQLIQKDLSNIPQDIIEKIATKFAIVGTPKDCIEKIKKYEAHGIKQLQLTPIVGELETSFYVPMWRGTFNMLEGVKYLGNKILPAFKRL